MPSWCKAMSPGTLALIAIAAATINRISKDSEGWDTVSYRTPFPDDMASFIERHLIFVFLSTTTDKHTSPSREYLTWRGGPEERRDVEL